MSLRGRERLTEESIFFVTTSIIKHANVFTQDKYCDILVRNILHYQKRYCFIILAYVIMPSHFHWIVIVDKYKGTISEIMRDIKKFSAWDIMGHLEKDKKTEILNLFLAEGKQHENHKRKFWQKRFHDEVVRNEKMFWAKRKYIHNNPVKAGLAVKPEHYKYSSARNYVLGDNLVLPVDTEYGGIEII